MPFESKFRLEYLYSKKKLDKLKNDSVLECKTK